jgi:hypothetical protein
MLIISSSWGSQLGAYHTLSGYIEMIYMGIVPSQLKALPSNLES